MTNPTLAGGWTNLTREQHPAVPQPPSAHAAHCRAGRASAEASHHPSSHSAAVPRLVTPELEPFVDAAEAAAFLQYCPRHLKKLAREGKVPAHPRGDGQRRRWLFKLSELDAWMMRRVNSACDPCREPRRIQ